MLGVGTAGLAGDDVDGPQPTSTVAIRKRNVVERFMSAPPFVTRRKDCQTQRGQSGNNHLISISVLEAFFVALCSSGGKLGMGFPGVAA
jgi:hypothetical protein